MPTVFAFQTRTHTCGIATCTLRAASDHIEPHWDEELPQESCSINNFPGVVLGMRGWDRGREGVMDGYFMADISPAVLVSVFL